MQTKSFVSLCLFIAFSIISFAQSKTVSYLYDPHYEMPDREIELYHMNAGLNIQPYDTLVEGEVEFSFKTLREQIDSIVFEVPELQISEIRIDNQPVDWKVKNNKAIVDAPEDLGWQTDHKILFIYTAKPTEGLYFIGWNDPQQIKRKQIWAHRPSHWLPYARAIHTVLMSVTVPGDLKVFSNGVREDVVTNKDNTKTWIYRMNHPHPFFSTCLVIGDYDYKTLETSGGLPVELWYYPDWEDHFEPTYKYQLEMFNYFESELGFEYPWELYRQAPVTDYMYGAMETTTATIFGDFLMVDERAWFGRNYVNVNAHELAHQWFGNYISHLKHKDVWLTESFGTYWAKMFEKHVFGDDYYQQVRNRELMDALEGSRKNNYSVGHSRGGRERIYQKGSLVMDMLRDILGDREFRAVMQFYLESHPYETAETNDFLQAIRKVTGRSMEWFFEQWIYRGGEPEYEISYEQLPGEVRVNVEQVHETNEITELFDMPIDFEVYYKDGSTKKVTRRIDEQYEKISIKNPEKKPVDFLLFDPNRKIIKTIRFDRDFDELMAQAGKAENMIDRYDALLELRTYPAPEKWQLLTDIYNTETFHLTKSEIIAQLATEWQRPEVAELMLSAVTDPDDKVRMAVLKAFPLIPAKWQEDFEQLLNDKSYFNVEIALENLCNSFPGKYGTYLDLVVDESGWRGRNIRMKWLEIAISRGGTAFIPELKNYSSGSYEFETRINAMHTLKKLNICDEQTATNMLEGSFHWNRKIRVAARENLRYFYRQIQHQPAILIAIAMGDFSDHQLQQMEKWFVE